MDIEPRIKPSGTEAKEWPWLLAIAFLYIAAAFGVGTYRGLYFVTAACIIAGCALFWRLLRSRVRSTPWAMWPFGICLASVGFFCLSGVYSYIAGRPSFMVILSGFGPSSQYLDARYRFEYHVRCADGDNSAAILLWTYPNNAAVSCMAMLFGPPRGAYDGPYPTFQEASRILAERGQPVSISEPPMMTFTVEGSKITPDRRSGRYLLAEMANRAHSGMLIGTILDNRCAIFGINDGEPLNRLFYVDVVKQRFLAVVYPPQPKGG